LPDPAADAVDAGAPGWEGRTQRMQLGHLGARARSALMTYLGVGSVLIALIIIFSLSQSEFFTYNNFLNILETNSVLLIVGVGLTFTLLVGGFDLSIGGVIALSGVLLAVMLQHGWSLVPAIIVCVVGGILVGSLLNGFLIAKLNVNFFVVTLGVAFAARGIALVITNGASQGLYEQKPLRKIGGGQIGFASIPIPVVIAVGILIAAILITRFTGFGRMIYAVGGNTEAARLAGINVVAVRLAAYAISAGLAAWGGVMEAGRLAAAAPDTDQGIEFTSAAAVLLGGTSFVGGNGGMFGTFLGVIFLGILQNGIIIASWPVYWSQVITGGVLIASVLIDRLRRGRLVGA
jgi:ribose transport system permease protein